MYTKQDLQKAKELIEKFENIALIIHKSPDPDAIGSACALYEILNTLEKNVKIFSPSIIDESLSFLMEDIEINILEANKIKDSDNWDLIVFLDGGELTRFSESEPFEITKNISVLKIDHHKVSCKISDVSLFSENASSTAEIVYEFVTYCDYIISSNVARLLMIGIIGDTGWFKYENTTAKTLMIVSQLLEINNCITELDFYFNRNLKSKILKIWKILMKNLVVDSNHSFLYTFISFEEKKILNIDDKLYSNGRSSFLDNVMRNFSDIEVSALITEKEEGKIHGSLRCNSQHVHVGKICNLFEEGGGHSGAGGFSSSKSLDEILQIIHEGIENYQIN